MTRLLLTTVALLAWTAACGKSDPNRLSECGASVGACAPAEGASCGVTFACKDKAYELRCTPPVAPDTKELECTCIEDNVIGKTVKVTWPMHGDAAALGSTACGWPK